MNTPQSPLHEVQFKPNKPLDVPKDASARSRAVNKMAANIVESHNAATPGEQREGRLFYPRAHNDARILAAGGNPRPNGPAAKGPVYTPPVAGQKHLHEVSPEETRQAAGVIARLSPSSPSGMTWEHNVGAAHQVMHMSDEEVQQTVGMASRSVKNQGSLAHAGGPAVSSANEIAKGRQTTDENIATGSKRVKIGSFANNIASPTTSDNVTVDARSHDIATGKRRGWEDVHPETGDKSDTRRLSGKKRYDMIEDAHQRATKTINDHLGSSLQPHQVQATTWLADDRDARSSRGAARGQQGGSGDRTKIPMPVGQTGKRVLPSG
jgi:hypothetical protein